MARPAWSFSRLKNFEQCPKKFWHTMIEKDIVEPENDTLRYGKRIHKALELRVRDGKRLPMEFTHLEPIAKRFAEPEAQPEILVEQQLAIDENMQPCDWFSKEAWCRAIIDYLAIKGETAVVCDYKTGRMYDDFTQLKLCAALVMLYREDVNMVQVVYWWTKDKKLTRDWFAREDLPELWNELLPRLERYDAAFKRDEFPARKNGLCGRFCPVKDCKYNG